MLVAKCMLVLVGLLSLSRQLVCGFEVLQNVPAVDETVSANPARRHGQHRRPEAPVDIKAFLAFRK